MSLPQKTYTDYKHLGDNGDDTTGSIQPIGNSEAVSMSTLRRPSENLRSRTEIVRSYQDDLLYYRDHEKYVLDLAGAGVLSWGGTAALGGTGIVNNSTQLTLRPFLGLNADIKGYLEVGSPGTNTVVYTVQPTAYATDGMNEITVEHRNVPGQVSVLCTISAGPIHRILVTLDTSNAAHDSAAVTLAVNTQIALTSALTGKLLVVDTGTPGNAVLAVAETALDTRVHGGSISGISTADAEAHVLAANALSTFTTTNPLFEGALVAVRYEYVIEPAGGDPNDPKGGVPGGRAESNVARGNSSVVPCLFLASSFPEWMPGAIPLVKIVQNVAVWLDGTNVGAGTTGRPGTALGTYINGAAFSGIPTLTIDGGISTAVSTVQDALVSVDQRLGQHRAVTYVLTDGSASTGGVFSASSALNAALTALGGLAGHITLRRGAYTLNTTIPAGTIIEGEGVGLVTVTLTANTVAGANSKISNLTVAGFPFTLSTSGRIEQIAGPNASIILLAGATARDLNNVRFTTVNGAGVTCSSLVGETLTVSSGSDRFLCDGLALSAASADISSLNILGANRCAFRNVSITGSAAQSTVALISSTGTNARINFQNTYVVRPDANTGALVGLSAGSSDWTFEDSHLVCTRGSYILNAPTSGKVLFENCTLEAPVGNTDATTARVYANTLVLVDSTVQQDYASVASIDAVNLYGTRTTFNLAWGKVSGSTPGLRMQPNGNLEFEDCTLTNTNPLQGGYRPIYGQPSGGGDPMISAAGNVRMLHVDFSTSAEVENSGGTSNPDFTFGMFLDVSRTVGTNQAPQVYLEDTGFFTSMPRHVNFSTDIDGSFFRFYDVNAGTASGPGRSRVEIVNFRTAAQPGSSVQAGTETLSRFFYASMTDVYIRDTLDYTWGSGGFTYAVYPSYYMSIAGNITLLRLQNVHAKITTRPVHFTTVPSIERVYMDKCSFYHSAVGATEMRLICGTAETHYIHSDFLTRRDNASSAGTAFAFYENSPRVSWVGTRFGMSGPAGANPTPFVLLNGPTGTFQIHGCTFEDDNASRSASELFTGAGSALALGHGNFILSAGVSFTNANLPLTPPVAGPYTTGGLNYLS